MIPDLPQFQEVLASLSVGEFSALPPGDKLLACESIPRLDAVGPREIQPEIGISCYRPTEMKLDSLIDRIEKEFTTLKHALFDGTYRKKRMISVKALCLAVVCSPSPQKVLSTLNSIFNSVVEKKLSLYAVLNLPPEDDVLAEFGEFSFGRLDVRRLEYDCQHAGSDYYKRYCSIFPNSTAAIRRLNNVKIFDFNGSPISLRSYQKPQQELSYRILDDYHSDIAEGFWEQFRYDMFVQQSVVKAAGGSSVTPKVFWQLNTLSKLVAIFNREFPGHGWVSPSTIVPSLNRVSPSEL